MVSVVFWVAFTLIVTHYFIFPCAIHLFSFLFGRPVRAAEITPTVSLIIAAYNEEAVIEAKLENVNELDYPKDKLEVIVVSDGSTDRTPLIVEEHASEGVIGLFSPVRRGKTDAINRAVKCASGEIVVFSDANNLYQTDSLKKLVRNLADPEVGAVSGQKRLIDLQDRESSRGDSAYWSVESRLKEKESLLGSISTGDGEIFALRRALYEPMSANLINDDMAITLNVVLSGSRVVYEPEAISQEAASRRLEEDFRVKARMVAGGYQILSGYAHALTGRPAFALQLLLHKGLRYFMPFLLLGLFASSLALGYHLIFLAQVVFYALASLGAMLRARGTLPKALYYPLYYVAMNAAALAGFFAFVRGQSVTAVWKKATR